MVPPLCPCLPFSKQAHAQANAEDGSEAADPISLASVTNGHEEGVAEYTDDTMSPGSTPGGLDRGMSEYRLDMVVPGERETESLTEEERKAREEEEVLMQKATQARLFDAIKRLNVVDVEQLLRAGASVKMGDDDGNTALHHAALYASAEKIHLLLRRGADAAVQNKRGETALQIALKAPRERGREAVRILEQYTEVASPNITAAGAAERVSVVDTLLVAAAQRSTEDHVKHLQRIAKKNKKSPLAETYIYYRTHAISECNKELFVAMRPMRLTDVLLEVLGKREAAVFAEIDDPPLDTLGVKAEETQGDAGVLTVETTVGVKQTGIVEFVRENGMWCISGEEWEELDDEGEGEGEEEG